MNKSIQQPPHTHYSDAELLKRFVREQDDHAFSALVDRHGPMVMSVCRHVLQHTQDTEDAFQATFLVLARKAGSIQRYRSVSSWLYKVAYRIALRARANKAQRKTHEQRCGAEYDGQVTPDANRDWDGVLDEEVQRLPEKYRAPILLCYLQGQTNEQAAQKLRCPTGTVKIRLLRARQMLRKRLTRRGVAVSVAVLLMRAGQSAQASIADDLQSNAVRAARDINSGSALANAPISPTGKHLAHTWLKRKALAKIKVGAALLLTALLFVGTDRLLQFAHSAPALCKQIITPTFVPEHVPTQRYEDLSPSAPQVPESLVWHSRPTSSV